MTQSDILSLGWKKTAKDGYYITVQEVNETYLEALLLPDGDQYEIQMKYSGKFAAPSDVVYLGSIPNVQVLKALMQLLGIKDFPAEKIDRYEPIGAYYGDYVSAEMQEEKDGDWVKYNDIKHLL